MKKTILITTIFTLLFTAPIYAFVYANHSCEAFNACDTEGYRGMAGGIGYLITEGAGYFLKSYADMLLCLNKIEVSELSGPDYPGLQAVVDSALENMKKASGTYAQLISAAKDTPYNNTVIEKLRRFDYKDFQEKNRLNRSILSRIEKPLRKGDVTAVYVLLKADMDDVAEQLALLKAGVDAYTFPQITPLWRLNQKYCESMLTGQYVAEVFKNL